MMKVSKWIPLINCKPSNDIFPKNEVSLEILGVIAFQNVIESLLYIKVSTTRLDIAKAMGIVN